MTDIMIAQQQTKNLRLERTFDATPQEMWAAWTDPKQYAMWFNPSGLTLVVHEFDVRPGGKIRFDMPQPDGNKNPQEGVFHELRPYTYMSSGAPDRSFLLEVHIEPRGKARCHLVVEVAGVPPEYHQMATVGWNQGFDHLEVQLARQTPIGGQSFTLERVFDCTLDEMWAAWTTPEQYAKWISPFPGKEVELHEFEPRVGGRARFTMIGMNGERYPEACFLYEKLEKPREIVTFEANRDRPDVFNGHPMRARARFEDVGGKTKLTLQQSGLPSDFPVEMAKQGFNACLDKLERLLA